MRKDKGKGEQQRQHSRAQSGGGRRENAKGRSRWKKRVVPSAT